MVLLGSSGSGKSTLLRCINFMEIPTKGRIYLNGNLIGIELRGVMRYRESELCKLRTRVGMVFQHFNLFPHMTAIQNVMEGPLTVLGLNRTEAEARARDLLAKVSLSEKADVKPAQLSGGQQQRVAIARALAMNPEVMLFDEVTSALDPELVGEVLRVVRQLAQEGMTMIIVTHEIPFARDVGDNIIFMDGGVILEAGPPAKVIANPSSDRLKLFLRRYQGDYLTT